MENIRWSVGNMKLLLQHAQSRRAACIPQGVSILWVSVQKLETILLLSLTLRKPYKAGGLSAPWQTGSTSVYAGLHLTCGTADGGRQRTIFCAVLPIRLSFAPYF